MYVEHIKVIHTDYIGSLTLQSNKEFTFKLPVAIVTGYTPIHFYGPIYSQGFVFHGYAYGGYYVDGETNIIVYGWSYNDVVVDGTNKYFTLPI